jgi:uncharacterized protein involved in cysteine biosynthesis
VILASFLKALAQLPDPRFSSVLWRGIGLTIALLVGLYASVLWLIKWFTSAPVTLPFVGEVTWLGDFLSWGSLGIFLLMSIFLMVPVASAMTSIFLDDVAQAVEDKHFPELPTVPPLPFSEGLRDTVNFLGVLVTANILAVALYVVFPFAAFFIFYALNGFLLGREYFQLAAMRRIGRAAAQDLRRQHQGKIWVAGCLMAVPLTFPLVNLVIPILGAATFTHLYHAVSRD